MYINVTIRLLFCLLYDKHILCLNLYGGLSKLWITYFIYLKHHILEKNSLKIIVSKPSKFGQVFQLEFDIRKQKGKPFNIKTNILCILMHINVDYYQSKSPLFRKSLNFLTLCKVALPQKISHLFLFYFFSEKKILHQY